jgi:hypothetical protein
VYEKLMFSSHDGRPFYTTQELADELDVSRPTMSKYLDEVKDKPGVRSSTVGQARVYWYDSRSASAERSLSADAAREEWREQAYVEILNSRAVTLDDCSNHRYDLVHGGVTFADKVRLIGQVSSYLEKATHWVNWTEIWHVVNYEDSDWFNSPPEGVSKGSSLGEIPVYQLGPSAGLTEEEVEYYLYEADLFQIKDGRVVQGLSEFLLPYKSELTMLLQDEDGNADIEAADVGEVRPILPASRDILSLVDAVDEFVTGYYNISW